MKHKVRAEDSLKKLGGNVRRYRVLFTVVPMSETDRFDASARTCRSSIPLNLSRTRRSTSASAEFTCPIPRLTIQIETRLRLLWGILPTWCTCCRCIFRHHSRIQYLLMDRLLPWRTQSRWLSLSALFHCIRRIHHSN